MKHRDIPSQATCRCTDPETRTPEEGWHTQPPCKRCRCEKSRRKLRLNLENPYWSAQMDVVGVSLLSLCYILKSISYRLNWKYELQNPFVRVEFAEHKKKKKKKIWFQWGFYFLAKTQKLLAVGSVGWTEQRRESLWCCLFLYSIISLRWVGSPVSPFRKR